MMRRLPSARIATAASVAALPFTPRRWYGDSNPKRANPGDQEDMKAFTKTSIEIYKRLKHEWDIGFESSYVIAFWLIMAGYMSWVVFKRVLEPYKAQVDQMPYRQRIPLTDEHNRFFKISAAVTEGTDPASIAQSDQDFERPGIVVSERSESFNVKKDRDGNPIPAGPGDTKTDIVVMQQQDFDVVDDIEVFYRSVHYLTTTIPLQGRRQDPKGMFTASREAPLPTGGGGDNRVHDMVRCKALSPTNNCIVDHHHIATEPHRKMLLALGPLYMLQNPMSNNYVPLRFVTDNETKQNTLVAGLGAGTLVNFFTRAFPHLKLDVVERDSTLLRIARRHLGFREIPGMSLFLEEPTEFIRRMLVTQRNKYDLVFLDCLLDENGKVPLEFSRLEFLTNLRNSLSTRGIVVANVPNDNDRIFHSTIANWRMAFDGKTILLIHCATAPSTILMTFNDAGDRGQPVFGTIGGVEEFKELLRASMAHWKGRVRFDLTGEIGEHNFQQLEPGKRYTFTRNTESKEDFDERHRKAKTTTYVDPSDETARLMPAKPRDKVIPKEKEWFGKVAEKGHTPHGISGHLATAPADYQPPSHTGMNAVEGTKEFSRHGETRFDRAKQYDKLGDEPEEEVRL